MRVIGIRTHSKVERWRVEFSKQMKAGDYRRENYFTNQLGANQSSGESAVLPHRRCVLFFSFSVRMWKSSAVYLWSKS